MLNIKLNRKEFLKRIQIVENAVSDDKAESVNSGIFIEARDNNITLKGMGDGLFIKADMPCETIENGEFVIRHKLIEEFLKQLDQDIIQIQENEGKINIISGKSSSSFSIYQYTKRNEPSISSGLEYTFEKDKLLNDLEKVKFAAYTGTEKLSVNCIRLEIDEEGLKLVSSDAHRLIYMNKKIEDFSFEENLNISIPLRTINSLIKIMRVLENKTINFKSEGTKVLFKFDDVEIITGLIDAEYPDYKSLLKSIKNDKKVTVSIKDLINTLKRVVVFVKEKAEKKDIASFEFKDNIITITGSNDTSSISEEIKSIYEVSELKMLINVKYLLDYLYKVSEKELLEIRFSNEKSPLILNVENDDEVIYLVAPSQ